MGDKYPLQNLDRAANEGVIAKDAERHYQRSLLSAALIWFTGDVPTLEAIRAIPKAAWIDDDHRAIAAAIVDAADNNQRGDIADVYAALARLGLMFDCSASLMGEITSEQPSCSPSLTRDRILECWDQREFLRKRHVASAFFKGGVDRDDVRTFLADLDLFDSSAEPPAPRQGVGDLIDDAIAGKRRPVHLPWPELNQFSHALMPGTVTVLCGNPGCGKSLFLLELAHAAHVSGSRVALYELEDNRAFHLLRLLAMLDRNPDLTDPEWIESHPAEAIAAREVHFDTLNSFARCIQDDPNDDATVDDISRWVCAQARLGARVIIVDPITVAEAGDKPWQAATRFMGTCAKAMVEYGASLIVSAHPKKGRSDYPREDEVAGGSSFVRRAQSILWIERHFDEHQANVSMRGGAFQVAVNRTLHVLKARNCKGAGTKVAFKFNDDTLRYEELGIENRARKGKPWIGDANSAGTPFSDDEAAF
jgi:KaiC/GvpD/RAD55 family RecA-like ATPase